MVRDRRWRVKNGTRRHRRGPESEATGENPAGMKKTSRVVEGDNKGRGYELKRGSYVEIEPEELEAVEVVSTRAISCAGSGSSIS
jgi:hypothetical protein